MLWLIMVGALVVGVVTGALAYWVAGRWSGDSPSRRRFYGRAFCGWFVGFASYSIATETYRPLFSETWLREAILGGDLIPTTLFAGFLAFATLRWFGPKESGLGEAVR